MIGCEAFGAGIKLFDPWSWDKTCSFIWYLSQTKPRIFITTLDNCCWESAQKSHQGTLTDWGRVTHIWPAPSHYLNQCWYNVNWTHRNKFQWNHDRNSYIFIQKSAFQMPSGKWWPLVSASKMVIPLYTIAWQIRWIIPRMNFACFLFPVLISPGISYHYVNKM